MNVTASKGDVEDGLKRNSSTRILFNESDFFFLFCTAADLLYAFSLKF